LRRKTKISSRGELYIDEECRDYFEVDLNDYYGMGNWKLDGSPFCNDYDISNFPDVVEVDVLDSETNELIGKVKIRSEFYVEGDIEKYIEIRPLAIERLDDIPEDIKNKEEN